MYSSSTDVDEISYNMQYYSVLRFLNLKINHRIAIENSEKLQVIVEVSIIMGQYRSQGI